MANWQFLDTNAPSFQERRAKAIRWLHQALPD
jgi:hypothetical protein